MQVASARSSAAVAARRSSTVQVSARRAGTARVQSRPSTRTSLRPAPSPAQSSRPKFAMYVMLVTVALLAVVGSYAYLAQQQFAIDRMKRERAEQQRQYEQRRLEVAQLTAPERIVNAAQQLGMVTPDHVTYIQVTEPLPVASDPTAEILSDGWQNVKADLAAPR